jgi:phosphate starvation-inducible PhoH-like protein
VKASERSALLSRPDFKPSPRRPIVEPDAAEITLAFDDNRYASLVFGQFDQNLAKIERKLGILANANGNHVTLKGPIEACENARHVLETLYGRVKLGQSITLGDVEGAIQEGALQGVLFPGETNPPTKLSFDAIGTRKKGAVRARNLAQDQYLKALKRSELVFAEGPAGTGKTWLAVGYAVSLLEQGVVERLILSRPIFDALNDFMDSRLVERGLQTGMIEVAPLAFMRGRTLSNACILLDEAQNATSVQMKMFLTRLGEGSRMIITGDPTQTDLPIGQKSGLSEAIRLLAGLEGISHAVFRECDVVRHDLVRRIVGAYEAAAAERNAMAQDRR